MALIRLMPTFSTQSLREGRCSVSGNAQNHSNSTDPTSPLEPVVDLDTVITSERGNLEIAMTTAREIASVIGWIDDDTAFRLSFEIEEARARISELEAAVEEKTQTISTLAGELAGAAELATKQAAVAHERGYAQGYEQGQVDALNTPEIPA